jgi:hypothetical protein
MPGEMTADEQAVLMHAFRVCFERFGASTGMAWDSYIEMFSDSWMTDLADWLPADQVYIASFGDDAGALREALSILDDYPEVLARRLTK